MDIVIYSPDGVYILLINSKFTLMMEFRYSHNKYIYSFNVVYIYLRKDYSAP